jgi:hypothetical protein
MRSQILAYGEQQHQEVKLTNSPWADGSSAAQRFFGRTFPPLFSWVFAQMGDLPSSKESVS